MDKSSSNIIIIFIFYTLILPLVYSKIACLFFLYFLFFPLAKLRFYTFSHFSNHLKSRLKIIQMNFQISNGYIFDSRATSKDGFYLRVMLCNFNEKNLIRIMCYSFIDYQI